MRLAWKGEVGLGEEVGLYPGEQPLVPGTGGILVVPEPQFNSWVLGPCS